MKLLVCTNSARYIAFPNDPAILMALPQCVFLDWSMKMDSEQKVEMSIIQDAEAKEPDPELVKAKEEAKRNQTYWLETSALKEKVEKELAALKAKIAELGIKIEIPEPEKAQ